MLEESNISQGTDDWKLVRRGIPTASNFDKILTSTTLKKSSSRDNYLNQLAAESVGLYNDWTGNQHTERGVALEPDAVFWYEISNDLTTEPTGFVWKDERRLVGGSPDRLVGSDGGLEIKCKNAAAHIAQLRSGKIPSENLGQVYGYLWITGREWWDFVSFHPDFATQFEVRISSKDEGYQKWAEAWEPEIEDFCQRLEELKQEVQKWFFGG
jgi:hypothetical protein